MTDLTLLIRRADNLRRLETNYFAEAWWAGYIRGLRRAQHGEAFGTEQEHQMWCAMCHSRDGLSRIRGAGYLAGLEGQWAEPPMSIFKEAPTA